MLKLYDKLLGKLLRTLTIAKDDLAQYRGYIHAKVRLRERFGIEYNRSLEKRLLSQNRANHNRKYYVGKTKSGSSIYKMKLRGKWVYPIYRSKRIMTFYDKELVDKNLN